MLLAEEGVMLDLQLERDVKPAEYLLTDVVEGLENSPAVFGQTTAERKEFLVKVRVVFDDEDGFMYVENGGTMHISLKYWKEAEVIDLYLDLVHELVHVRQAAEGKDLYDNNYDYVERPTELEAYETAVKEARRLDLPKERAVNHTNVPWVTQEELALLRQRLGIV